MNVWILIFSFCCCSLMSQHVELGSVDWMRDYNLALAKAKAEQKAVLILFQEVPGCSTCQNYGRDVLSKLLLVDAIENYFVPLVIFNNKGGEDKRVLQIYKEPTWNNPVVRIVDENGKNILKRLAGDYSASGLVSYMQQSFPVMNKEIPSFLIYLEDRLALDASDSRSIDFSMYCFWSGEAHFGNREGIISTSPGFMNGKEVVRINYAPNQISETEIKKHGLDGNCEFIKEEGKFRQDKDPQYYLKRTNYKYLALEAHQRTKINSLIQQGKSGINLLSPTQLKYLNLIESKNYQNAEMLYDQEFNTAWNKMKSKI